MRSDSGERSHLWAECKTAFHSRRCCSTCIRCPECRAPLCSVSTVDSGIRRTHAGLGSPTTPRSESAECFSAATVPGCSRLRNELDWRSVTEPTSSKKSVAPSMAGRGSLVRQRLRTDAGTLDRIKDRIRRLTLSARERLPDAPGQPRSGSGTPRAAQRRAELAAGAALGDGAGARTAAGHPAPPRWRRARRPGSLLLGSPLRQARGDAHRPRPAPSPVAGSPCVPAARPSGVGFPLTAWRSGPTPPTPRPSGPRSRSPNGSPTLGTPGPTTCSIAERSESA